MGITVKEWKGVVTKREMIKIYSTEDWLQVATFKSVLESYGIICEIKSDFPNVFKGKASFHALYVLDDAQGQEAKDILAQSQTDSLANRPSWTCPTCKEVIEGQFDQCWQCGASR